MVGFEEILGKFGGFEKLSLGLLNTFYYLIILACVIGAAVVVFWWMWKRPRYNIVAEVHAERATGTKPFLTKAAKLYDKKAGVWKFKVKGFKKEWPLPDSKYFITTVNGRDMIYLFYKNGEIFPMTPPEIDGESVGKLIIPEGDIQFWAAARREITKQTFQTLKDKLIQMAPYALFVVSMVIFMIIFNMLLKKFDVLGSVASNLKETAQALQSCRAVTVPS